MPFPTFLFAFPLAIAGLGGAFAWSAISFRRFARAGARWPTVEGTILRSHVTTRVDDDDDKDEPGTLSSISVLYGYQVDGREYRSTRLYAGKPVWSGSARAAEKAAERYKLGARVTVYYNPAQPAFAMLEPLNMANAKLATIGAIAFGGAGLFFTGVMMIAAS